MDDDQARTAETTNLLQDLIRNQCVNDGTVGSGRSGAAPTCSAGHLEGTGVDLEVYEPEPGRTSLVAKIEGSDPAAPSLTLLGHTDVVTATPEDAPRPFRRRARRRRGLGAGRHRHAQPHRHHGHRVLRHLARDGFRPAGSLTYVAVADEEGRSGPTARNGCRNAADDVNSDDVVTETGGIPIDAADGVTRLPVMVAEKGAFWCKLTVRAPPATVPNLCAPTTRW